MHITLVGDYWQARVYWFDEEGEHTNNYRVIADLETLVKLALEFLAIGVRPADSHGEEKQR